MEPIVITGAGIVSAIGVGKADTLDALRSQRTGIAPLHYLKTAHHEFPVGEVKLTDEEMKAIGEIFAPGHVRGGVLPKMHYKNGKFLGFK